MNESFKIEKGVPAPPSGTGCRKYPLDSMQIGDSFEFPAERARNVRARAADYKKAAGGGIDFTVRCLRGKPTGRIWRIAGLLLPLIAACAVEIAVDQPREWANPQASHHGKHALGGAVIGGAAYIGARAMRATRFQAWAAATLIGCGAQVVYEARAGYKNGCQFDIVDIGWGALGSSAAAGLLAGGDYAVDLIVNRERAAVAVSWSF